MYMQEVFTRRHKHVPTNKMHVLFCEQAAYEGGTKMAKILLNLYISMQNKVLCQVCTQSLFSVQLTEIEKYTLTIERIMNEKGFCVREDGEEKYKER